MTDEEIIVGIDKVHEYLGASGFLEIKLPWILSSVIGRYDWFRKEDVDTQRIIEHLGVQAHAPGRAGTRSHAPRRVPDSLTP